MICNKVACAVQREYTKRLQLYFELDNFMHGIFQLRNYNWLNVVV